MTMLALIIIVAPIILVLCACIALDEHHDLTGHFVERAWVRALLARINTYLDNK